MIFWIIHMLILGVLSYFTFKQLKSPFNSSIFWTSMGLKLTAGIGVGLIFHFYYGTGDTLVLFAKAEELSNLDLTEHVKILLADGSYATTNHPRDLFFTKLISIFARISGGSYWITSLYLSFISFVASWHFTITISKVFPNAKEASLIAFLFIPSIIFWSSGVLKDSISFAALVFSVGILLRGIYEGKGNVLEILLAVISVIVLFHLKHYLFITFIVFTGLFLSLYLLKKFKKRTKWIIVIVVMISAVSSTQFVHPYLKWDRIPQTILEINQTILVNSVVADQSMILIEEASWKEVLSASPKALHIGLFRPSIFDETILFGWIHRIENLLLVTLILFSILLWIKEKKKVDLILLLPSICSICLLALMLALTTPNFGTLVRYKNAFMPFLFLLALVLPIEHLTTSRKTSDQNH